SEQGKEAPAVRRSRVDRCWLAPAVLIPVVLLLVMSTPHPPATKAAPPANPTATLTRAQVSAFARLALQAVKNEYPTTREHALAGPDCALAPRPLHRAFYGSYDWHSCVPGYWMLARLLRLFPRLPEATEIRAVLTAPPTADNLQAEADSFARPEAKSFE